MKYTSKSLDETKKLAKAFANTLKGGEVVELIGDLGSGKTTFVRGIVETLGSDARVKSPTFTIMNEYPIDSKTVKRIVHLDLYRFKSEEELEALALGDYVRNDTVLCIEWPDVFETSIVEDAKKIEFTFIDEETREIEF